MAKIGQIIIVASLVITVYLIMLVTMPVLVDITYSVNSSMNATNLPGSSEALIAAPWVLWFVPGVIGMIAVVVILRRP